MKNLLIYTSILILTSCAIQKGKYKVSKKETTEKYANTITVEELKKHLTILASDEYEGRETGKKGQIMTGDYLKNEFIKMGIAPGNNGSYFQNFTLTETTSPTGIFNYKNKIFNYLEDFYFYQNYTSVNNVTINVQTEDIIFVSHGIKNKERDDYKNLNLKGKTAVILVENPEKIKFTWRQKLDAAKKNGAEVVFFYSEKFKENTKRLEHYLTKSKLELGNKLNTEKKNINIPFFFISKEFYTQLTVNSKEDKEEESKFSNYNKLKFFTTSNKKLVQSNNVLGFIEGSDEELKKEVIIITAHYDHLGIINGVVNNGADDDGSGTVALLEIAQAFQIAKNEGNGPKRSVLIMPVSGEEKGLLGSSYYADNPVFPLKNTVVDLNIDMIGRIDTFHTNDNYVYLIGADKISEELHYVSEAVNKTYSNLELDYRYNNDKDPNRFYYRSDHYNFAKKGIPVIFYFTGVHEDYHKPTDDIEKILFPKLARITKLVFYTAWEIANKEERLKITTTEKE